MNYDDVYYTIDYTLRVNLSTGIIPNVAYLLYVKDKMTIHCKIKLKTLKKRE